MDKFRLNEKMTDLFTDYCFSALRLFWLGIKRALGGKFSAHLSPESIWGTDSVGK